MFRMTRVCGLPSVCWGPGELRGACVLGGPTSHTGYCAAAIAPSNTTCNRLFPVFLSFQKGTLRMNCLDCLDRTNTVQSFIALEVCPAPAPRPSVVSVPSAGQAGPAPPWADEGVAGLTFSLWGGGRDVLGTWRGLWVGWLASDPSDTLFMHLRPTWGCRALGGSIVSTLPDRGGERLCERLARGLGGNPSLSLCLRDPSWLPTCRRRWSRPTALLAVHPLVVGQGHCCSGVRGGWVGWERGRSCGAGPLLCSGVPRPLEDREPRVG